MKKKDFKEMKNKDTKELVKILLAKKADLLAGMPNTHVGKEKNLKKTHNFRIEIAQILTLIKEKELEAKEETK